MEVYVAGAIAAFTVDVLVYPLDTLKTRYQSQDFIKTYAATSNAKPLAFRGLYQGIGSVVLATLPAAGVFFSTYESTKNIFSRNLSLPEPLVYSSASAVAESASCLVLAPAEVIKQNAQMLRNEGGIGATGSTSLQAFRQLGGEGAVRRLFTGYTALLARNLPFTAIQFPVFEHVRAGLRESTTEGNKYTPGSLKQTFLISGFSAGSAGSFAAFVTTPSDVVKTRMMLSVGEEHHEQGHRGKHSHKKGAWRVAQEVWSERGLKGFFRGGLFRSAWTAMGSGLYLGTYDVAKVWLERRKEEKGDIPS
ncbi:hypothetical protein S40285_03819 [Stachybotrys chlorohalonatus IBT 40285]|uniref:Mitochondrial carrier n=1 Tax=Stachybotrys chlorohalonatus (strain IBT 40285) TaxID=1283841 RepID=A0A084QFU1_STAC4|nr:hypothetical protein S40285_03819 [Stachybotrys chlorohalonata IBT 40285]